MSYSVKTLLKVTGSVALVLAVCFALVGGVTGCGGNSKEDTGSSTTLAGVTSTTVISAEATALVGQWYSERAKETLEFTSDGKMIWTKDGKQPQTFTFDVAAGVIMFQQPNAPDLNRLPFTIQGTTLTTTDLKYGTLTYTKK